MEEEKPLVPVVYHWDIIRQATWRTDFSDTHFVDTNTGWAVGSAGAIAHTKDGGKTWLPQHSGVSVNLRDVQFTDHKHGRILASNMILQTENGGETWKPMVKTTQQNLPRISMMKFINKDVGWLGASIGQVLHTTDGGKTWQVQKTGTTNANITDLHFINDLEGWAIAPQRRDGGFVLQTVDGGKYWKIQSKTNQAGIAVHFADAKNGWVILGNGNSLISNDGGETWKMQITKQSPNRLRNITFRSHTHAWGIGDGSAYITKDQGLNWQQIPVSIGSELLATRPQPPEIRTQSTSNEEKENEDTTAAEEFNPFDAFQRQLSQQRQQPGNLAPEGTVPSLN